MTWVPCLIYGEQQVAYEQAVACKNLSPTGQDFLRLITAYCEGLASDSRRSLRNAFSYSNPHFVFGKRFKLVLWEQLAAAERRCVYLLTRVLLERRSIPLEKKVQWPQPRRRNKIHHLSLFIIQYWRTWSQAVTTTPPCTEQPANPFCIKRTSTIAIQAYMGFDFLLNSTSPTGLGPVPLKNVTCLLRLLANSTFSTFLVLQFHC